MSTLLEQRLRAALQGLYLVSQGTTANLNGDLTTGTKERGLFPAGDGHPAYEEYARKWAGARTESARLEVVEAAELELERWKRAAEPVAGIEPERGSWAWKKQIANDSRPVAKVAQLNSVSRVTVYEYIRRYRDLRRAA